MPAGAAICPRICACARGLQLTSSYLRLNDVSDRDAYGSSMRFIVMVDTQDPSGDTFGSVELWPRTAYVVLPGKTEVSEVSAACMCVACAA